MASYTTTHLDSLPAKFNSINDKIEVCIEEFLNSYDYENLNRLITDIKSEYKGLKNALSDILVEVRINILEIDDLKVFERYKKYCNLRMKAIHTLLEPQDIDSRLNADDYDFLSHANLNKYGVFNVPEELNAYNLSGYLYTYSLMLSIIKKSILGIVDKLQFQNTSDETLEIFDEKEEEVSATLRQKILVIKYLENEGLLSLNKIHQDRTKQARIIHFLIGHSFKTTYDALNESIVDLIKPQNAAVVLDLFESQKDSFASIVSKIKSDMKSNKI